MLYRGYIDDSADRDRERVIISGAIIGREDSWDTLNKQWQARLREDKLQYFKSSHCRTLNGQFHKFRSLPDGSGKAQAIKVEQDLDVIIHSLDLVTLGIVLPVPFYNTMLSDPKKFGQIPKVPYYLAFQQVLAECAKAMIALGRNNIITFGHDDGSDFHVLHDIYKEFKKKNPRYAKVMADFVPLDDKMHPEVQAADVAAAVTHGYAENWVQHPTADNLDRLRKSMYKIVIWDEAKAQKPSIRNEATPAKARYVI